MEKTQKKSCLEKKFESGQIQIKIAQQTNTHFNTYQVHWGTQFQLNYKGGTLDYIQKIEKAKDQTNVDQKNINRFISDNWSTLSRDYKNSEKIHISQSQKILYFMLFRESGGGQSYHQIQYIWISPDIQSLIEEGIEYFISNSEKEVTKRQMKRVQRQLRQVKCADLQDLYYQPGILVIEQVQIDDLDKSSEQKVEQERNQQYKQKVLVQQKDKTQQESIKRQITSRQKNQKDQVEQGINKKRKLNQE